MNDMNGYPIIHLEGSDGTWESGYAFGQAMSELYPKGETWDFGCVISYHPTPDLTSGIANLKCFKVGQNDEESWIWEVELGNGEKYEVVAWCDYTGWDCCSGSEWRLL